MEAEADARGGRHEERRASNTARLSGGSGLEQGCGGDGFRLRTSHGMPVETAWKLCCLMQMTWRGPADLLSVSRLPGVSVQGGPGLGIWRVGLANMAPAAPPPSGLKHHEIYSAKFYHGTNVRGLHGILRDGKLRALPAPAGAGAHGVYAKGYHLWPGTAEGDDRTRCVQMVLDGNKCGFGVMFEAEVMQRAFQRLSSGGIEAEAQTVTIDRFTHLKTKGENRWCAHQDSLHIVAVVLREDLIVNQ